jgi:hypothetical protein
VTEHVIKIEDGAAEFVYADELIPLTRDGDTIIRRVSHVEPCAGGGWTADMSPVAGPVLGPFATREEGLTAERAWLRSERGL